MAISKNIENYANEIASLYLGNLGYNKIIRGKEKHKDFIIDLDGDGKGDLFVDVKASKYSLPEIKSRYHSIAKKYSRRRTPTLFFFINYLEKSGYFQIVGNNKINEIKKLDVSNLKSAIKDNPSIKCKSI